MNRKERNSTIELLRIQCMFVLIFHHMCVHGGLLQTTSGINGYIALLFVPVGKIAFCCFLAISMYFLTEQEVRMKKYLSIWLMVLFYNVIFTLVAMLVANEFQFDNFFASFFPILGNSHGFAAAYLAFYLLMPILRMLILKLSDIQLKYFLIILFLFQCMTKILGDVTGYYQNLGSELTLFVFCFFLQLYLKRNSLPIVKSKMCLIGIIVLTYLLRLSINLFHPQNVILGYAYKVISSIVGDESGILNILAGFALFYLFLNFKETHNAIINFIASASFPVLLIHDHNVLRGVIWSKIFCVQNYSHNKYLLIIMLAIAIVIYLFGILIEIIRKKISNKILNNKRVNMCIERIDSILNEE